MASDGAHRAIGIFDSGVGGLTVLREVTDRLPHESTVYLGDTARVPYGTKSGETVIRYAGACADILMGRGIKLLVVACNTASAYALEVLRDKLPIPVIGVVAPGAQRAVEHSRSGRIGVIGTAGTIGSGQYQDTISSFRPEARVFTRACPLFVPLAEEGWTDGDVPMRVAREYLGELLEQDIDTLVLGCTHYPLLKDTIAQVAGPDVALVDSAEATSAVVAETLESLDLLRDGPNPPTRQFLVTDAPDSFARIGKRFLGYDIPEVEWVDFQ